MWLIWRGIKYVKCHYRFYHGLLFKYIYIVGYYVNLTSPIPDTNWVMMWRKKVDSKNYLNVNMSIHL